MITATLKPNTADNNILAEGYAIVNDFFSLYVKVIANKKAEGQVYVMFGTESWKSDKCKGGWGNRTTFSFVDADKAEIFKKALVDIYNGAMDTKLVLTPYKASKRITGEVSSVL